LNLLMGKYEYEGSIASSQVFDYFPYPVSKEDLQKTAAELVEIWKPRVESWQVLMQVGQLGMDAELLYRPFGTLSHGERTRVMLAVLFADENEFLLIDEPTNHLDMQTREVVKRYLASKKGFILVSHDRDLLDAVIDHVLVFNRTSVEVQAGNFSTWWENKERADAFAQSENEKHLKEIGKLREAVDRSSRWAQQNESTKIGFDPVKEPDRTTGTRSYIGAKTKKMQARVKAYEKRIDREISEKEGLLQDLEHPVDLKLNPLRFHKEVLIRAYDLRLCYEGAEPLFEGLRFEVKRGDRLVLSGENGCGKSSIIKCILEKAGGSLKVPGTSPLLSERDRSNEVPGTLKVSGTLECASGLIISYVSQDTSYLAGTLREFCKARGLEESLLLAVLRQLDFGREQFIKDMADFSEGQKKKVLVASSLITPAHLYIWDEPLNFIDVFSRMQIENLILQYEPTMLLVEHDVRFRERIATQVVEFA
nr:ATP-binding cassette domain-containing protein [Lachnospiraceae bacterium]